MIVDRKSKVRKEHMDNNNLPTTGRQDGINVLSRSLYLHVALSPSKTASRHGYRTCSRSKAQCLFVILSSMISSMISDSPPYTCALRPCALCRSILSLERACHIFPLPLHLPLHLPLRLPLRLLLLTAKCPPLLTRFAFQSTNTPGTSVRRLI